MTACNFYDKGTSPSGFTKNLVPLECMACPFSCTDLWCFFSDPDDDFIPFVRETFQEVNSTEEGGCVVNGYTISKTLGKGVIGKVKLAQKDSTHQLYAIKIYNKRKLRKQRTCGMFNQALQSAYAETSILKPLRHPNIVSAVEIIDDPQSNKMFLVLEYVSGGPLMVCCALRQLAEEEAREHFIGLMKGVEYLHSRRIVHRDLKPDNLLFDPVTRTLKICDFTSAQVLSPGCQTLNSSFGTPLFFAPELCASYENPPEAMPTDVWAMGITLFCFIFGDFPFEITAHHMILYDRILSFDLKFPHRELGEISTHLKDFLTRILAKDPRERITIAEMKVHPWICNS
eukprot:TRINITY_DN852_c0_g1_i4.p1 TRINITY_DN852_c0_g1~~TRINITY_DN852_c0_g1_i4.p1  ORF type:complete len:343 (-),score=41.45 TRINITY_DN852_c0_g1_i4:202-1230(-)